MLKQALDRRAEQGRPIQVGVVGAGRVGMGAICQIGLMKGSRNAVIATSAPSPSFGRASYADVAARTWGSPIQSRPRRMRSEAAGRSRLFGAAKRPPKADKIVDGAGGAFVYAMNDLYEVAKAENVVPLGLLIGAKLRCDVPNRQARDLRYGRCHRQHDPLSPSRHARRWRRGQIPARGQVPGMRGRKSRERWRRNRRLSTPIRVEETFEKMKMRRRCTC